MTDTNPRPNPYVGPRAFQTGERLHGRDAELRDLLDLLIAERIVLLHSPSGAGKSSLVQAGLIPLLADEGFDVLPLIRLNQEPPVGLGKDGQINRYTISALLSVLAALAIYGVRRYLASSKSSEAKNTIGAISRGATAAYERETAAAEAVGEGSVSTAASHALCGPATPVPVAVPAGRKYQPNTAEGNDYETGDTQNGWKCLKFGLTQPHYYQYRYITDGTGALDTVSDSKCSAATCYEAAAAGDLDGDSTTSVFARSCQVNTTTGKLKASTQVYIQNEFE